VISCLDAAQVQEQLVELIGEVVGLLELDEFRPGLLRALRRVVPCEWISLNDLGPEPGQTTVLIDPPFPPEAHALYARHAFENPLVARYQRTADGRAYRFSDVATAEELKATALYREFYGPLGLEHQIAFTLPHAPERLIALALSRAHLDFSDSERDLLDRARPFLIQTYRNAIEHSRLLEELQIRQRGWRLPLDDPRLAHALASRGLTAREAEVLSWVATGRSNRAVAAQINVSERTVQKHVQRCFSKLKVHTRTEAVALAWSHLSPQSPPDP
jgi:DNA-binding CsgD family transcriptional regulator